MVVGVVPQPAFSSVFLSLSTPLSFFLLLFFAFVTFHLTQCTSPNPLFMSHLLNCFLFDCNDFYLRCLILPFLIHSLILDFLVIFSSFILSSFNAVISIAIISFPSQHSRLPFSVLLHSYVPPLLRSLQLLDYRSDTRLSSISPSAQCYVPYFHTDSLILEDSKVVLRHYICFY